ncbi:predicted protein [Chaetoceros tenuissimus]|uniref:Myb-like domain-containing protein n=1 Tax=Chaetoceros tenuissimus TaxID=426638 RepID=A0AAD3H8K7_9STRA|nr:predicted protein [Chaetoceros tenuissimus]
MSPPKINAIIIGRNPSTPLVSTYVLTQKEKRLSEKRKKERQEILLDRQQEKEFHRRRLAKAVSLPVRPNATVIGRNPSTPSVTSTLYANPPKDRATKYEGVYLISSHTPKCGGIYAAKIKDWNGKEIFIGTFTLACDAAYNYDRSHRFFDMGKCNFQSLEEYLDAYRREVTARVDEYYGTFSEEEKKILSKQQLREKIVEIHKGNRLSKEYLISKLKGTNNVGRTRSIHLDTVLANLLGKQVTGPWRKDEVTKLLELEKNYEKSINKWELISKGMGNRSASQCRNKFLDINKFRDIKGKKSKHHNIQTKRKQPTSTSGNVSTQRKQPKMSLPISMDVQLLLKATNLAQQVVNIQKVRGEYKSILQLTHRQLEAYSRKQSMKVLEKEIEASSMSPYMENKIKIQTNAFVTAHILARRENGMSVN